MIRTPTHSRGALPRAAWLAAACAAALGGCADLDDRPPTWSYVHAAVIEPNCTSSNCHSELARIADVKLDSRAGAYRDLVGRSCDPDSAGEQDHNFVVPFRPESSRLMYLLRGEETRRMPPDVGLPDVEIELIERWILEGARCD